MKLRQRLGHAYARLFASPSLSKLNDALLQLALRGRGYNNYIDANASGENYFIERLSALEPKVCIDVGANVGKYSRALLERSNTRVIAFEPLPKSFARLNELSHLYGERFQCINLGVAEVSGVRAIHFGERFEEWASFSAEVSNVDYVGKANKDTLDLRLTSLDDFFLKERPLETTEVDLLKIDTEGYELNVLRGAKEFLAKYNPKFIQLEMNWHQLFVGSSLWTFGQHLAGYTAFQLLPYGNGMREVQTKDPLSNIFEFANFVFVRRDISTKL